MTIVIKTSALILLKLTNIEPTTKVFQFFLQNIFKVFHFFFSIWNLFS